MYIGEMVLLSGHLYRFGSGFLFEGLAGIVLAPFDILVIIASGCITAALCHVFNKPIKRLAACAADRRAVPDTKLHLLPFWAAAVQIDGLIGKKHDNILAISNIWYKIFG